MQATLAPQVGDLRQVASVRRIVLDDGAERGVRALAFSTGGGLDFWVLSDRSLDIGPLWWRGAQLAWQAPDGFRSPALTDLDSEDGQGFNRAFSGFLVTCGLDHIRQPANGRPLHGRLPFSPARVTAYGEDWSAAEPVLFCEGEVTQARIGGEALRLRRRIEAPIGGAVIRIRDEVENLGAAAWPQAMLYHFNLGYPAVMSGSSVRLDDEIVLGPLAMPSNAEPAEAVTLPAANGRTTAVVSTPIDGAKSLSVSFSFDTRTLPFIQLWQDLRPRSRHSCYRAVHQRAQRKWPQWAGANHPAGRAARIRRGRGASRRSHGLQQSIQRASSTSMKAHPHSEHDGSDGLRHVVTGIVTWLTSLATSPHKIAEAPRRIPSRASLYARAWPQGSVERRRPRQAGRSLVSIRFTPRRASRYIGEAHAK